MGPRRLGQRGRERRPRLCVAAGALATLPGEVAGISSIGAFVRRLGYREQVALAVTVGLAVRVALAVSDDVITNDASAYLRSGGSLWAGDGFRRRGGRTCPPAESG